MENVKFRAWRHNFEDPEYSQMITSHQGVYTALRHCLGLAVHAHFSNCDNQPHPEQYVLMQYIGLNDCNGKEIYEGDIVQSQHFMPSVIKFEEGCFMFEDITYSDAQFTYEDNQWEIIGNIYENPEFIK